MKKEYLYDYLTSKDFEKELNRVNAKTKYINTLKSIIYSLVVVSAFSILIAFIFIQVLQISGKSMEPTLHDNNVVLVLKNKNVKNNDVIAFYQGNKILIKRVIASAGSWVKIDDKGNVYVDDVLLDEPYISKKTLGNVDIEFPYQVPPESYFVLGDERESSNDSRISQIGPISKDDVIGKVFFTFWPIKNFSFVK